MPSFFLSTLLFFMKQQNIVALEAFEEAISERGVAL